MHYPVLLKEVIEFLAPKPGSFIIDGTVDGGGHSAAILERISPKGVLLGIDWDRNMSNGVKERIAEISNSQFPVYKFIFVHGNYADLPEILRKRKLGKADGLLLDLGFSSEQLESSKRGFSFGPSADGEPLLMTYDSGSKPVKRILIELGEKELAKIIFDLSGEKFAARIAGAIKTAEKVKIIETSDELARIVRHAVPGRYERGRIDPATRTFQALRIYANDELGNLRRILSRLPEILNPGGRVVVISFHSLEDRLVKDAFRSMARVKNLKILTKKPVIPSREEILKNPRSRSAKLRAAVIS